MTTIAILLLLILHTPVATQLRRVVFDREGIWWANTLEWRSLKARWPWVRNPWGRSS